MNKPKITEGEWHLAIYNYRAEVTNGGLPIANVQACHDVRWKESARLIAAAPAMAEILARILYAHESPPGASNGEATLCPMFADMAKEALESAGYIFP